LRKDEDFRRGLSVHSATAPVWQSVIVAAAWRDACGEPASAAAG